MERSIRRYSSFISNSSHFFVDILQKFYCQQNNQELDRRQKIEYIKRRMRGLHEMVLNNTQTRNLSEVEFKSTFHENITSADRHLR